jgi:hypothetical protein
MSGSVIRRIVGQASPGKMLRFISKIIRAKWAGGMSQVVEHLPTKCEALSSNPNTTKKKKMPPYI